MPLTNTDLVHNTTHGHKPTPKQKCVETQDRSEAPKGWALFEMLENGMPLTSKVLAIPDICTPNELQGIVRVPDDRLNSVPIWDLLDTPEIQTPLKIYKPTDPEVIEGLRKIFNQAQLKQGTP